MNGLASYVETTLGILRNALVNCGVECFESAVAEYSYQVKDAKEKHGHREDLQEFLKATDKVAEGIEEIRKEYGLTG